MDGLLLAEVLARLSALLPSARSAWRFLHVHVAELTLADGQVLRIESRPGRPLLSLVEPGRDPGSGAAGAARETDDRQAGGRRRPTAFQALLAARAAGDLSAVRQFGLDRVVTFEFARAEGFVPTPAHTLIFELTGNHANLILTQSSGEIIAVERPPKVDAGRGSAVVAARLRPGARYAPPAPQAKLDPRVTSESELAAALVGRRAGEARALIDGVGTDLQGALEAATGYASDARLDRDAAARLAGEVVAMARAPAAYVGSHVPQLAGSATAGGAPGSDLQRLRAAVAKVLRRRLKTASARRADAEAAVSDVREATRLRAEGDLLLAVAGEMPSARDSVEVTGFDGTSQRLALDPALSLADNAQERYRQARRAESKARAGTASLPDLLAAERELAAELEALGDMSETDLKRLLESYAGGQAKRPQRSREVRIGNEFVDPRGFSVVVGRGAKDNDALTFKVARAKDIWLHAQGYRGAHVVIRAAARQVPFETILFAARLAAGHSEARGSDNVAVDYTERKNVWRPKGGAPGAVHFAHHKTVFVTPARDAAAAEGS